MTLPPPPPDPAEVVAEYVLTYTPTTVEDYADAVRYLLSPEALAQAAKIVTGGEEGSGVVPHGTAAPCTDPSGDTAAAKVQEAQS